MKLFKYDIHLGKYRVLIGTRDIQNGAVKTRCIADGAITGEKIQDNTVTGRNIADDAVTGEKIQDNTVTGRNIAPEAIDSQHIADESITGDEFRPNGVKPGKIANDAIMERNIKDGNVTLKKLSGKLQNFLKLLAGKDDDLQNQIDSIVIGGHAMSNHFGDDPHIGISQKAITEAINKIWSKIEDITGESILGFQMDITPEYYIGEDGCNIHVTATTVDTVGVFEEIRFLINGIQVWPTTEEEGKNVSYAEFDTEISETSVVECDAKILGVPYSKQAIITHYNSFWLGAGTTYEDVMSRSNLRPIENGMRGAYDVDIAEGEYIFVIVGESLRKGFIRADINGLEIAFGETTVTIDGNTYRVLKSENTYQAGTYNIDING